MMTRRICVLIMMVVGVMSPGAQAQKANLNGTWKLDLTKSFMGGDHLFPDYRLTRKIELKGSTISITDSSVHNSVVNIPLPDATMTMELSIDGKEHEVQLSAGFPGRPPSKVKVTAEWQGCTLEIVQMTSGFATYGKQRLFLSDDGSQLIDLVEQHSIYGDSEQRLVFDKVP